MQIFPVNRPKSAAKRIYDRLSPIYDELAGSSEAPLTRLGLEILAVKPSERILEIGSGTGKTLVLLGDQVGPSGSVHGIDLSRGMLRQAQRRLAKAEIPGRYNLVEGDGARLPYAGDQFCAAFLSFTLELFDTPEIEVVLGECRRVLKPGGRLGLVTLFRDNHPGAIVRIYEWFHLKLPAFVDCRPINAGSMLQESGFRLENRLVKAMWGLPVEILVARKA